MVPFIDTSRNLLGLFFLIIPETEFPGLLRSPGFQIVNTSTRGHSELLIIFQAMAATSFSHDPHSTRPLDKERSHPIWGGIIDPYHQEKTGKRHEGKEKYV